MTHTASTGRAHTGRAVSAAAAVLPHGAARVSEQLLQTLDLTRAVPVGHRGCAG
jgi:hypothetical protein